MKKILLPLLYVVVLIGAPVLVVKWLCDKYMAFADWILRKVKGAWE